MKEIESRAASRFFTLCKIIRDLGWPPERIFRMVMTPGPSNSRYTGDMLQMMIMFSGSMSGIGCHVIAHSTYGSVYVRFFICFLYNRYSLGAVL